MVRMRVAVARPRSRAETRASTPLARVTLGGGRGAVVDRLTVCTVCESVSYMWLGNRARGELSGSFGGVMLALRTAFLISAPLLVTGCNAILWGNLGVLCVTVGIFLGTVFLSRSSAATRSAARSTASGASAAPSVAPPA